MMPRVSAADVLLAVMMVGNVNLSDLCAPGRDSYIVKMRRVYTWVAHETFRNSYPAIAKAMRRTGHSTFTEMRQSAEKIRNSPGGGDFLMLCQAVESKALEIATRPMKLHPPSGSPAAVKRLIAIVNAANPNGCTGTPATVEELAQAVRKHTYRARPVVDRVMDRNRGHA